MNSTHLSPSDAMRQQQEDRHRAAAYHEAEQRKLQKDQVEALRHIVDSTNALLPPIQKQAEAAKEQAEASMIQAQLAIQKAKKADTKGIIALILSIIALAVDIIVNRQEIISFFSELLGR